MKCEQKEIVNKKPKLLPANAAAAALQDPSKHFPLLKGFFR